MNEACQDRLLDLAKRDGKLTAESVLAEAADPDSPLHPLIEWDDAVAAHEHRLEQCRFLIRQVQVEVVSKNDPEPRRVRGLVHIPSTDSYQPLQEVMSDADMRAEHVARLKLRMKGLRAEIKMYAEFDEVSDAIRRVVEDT